MWDLGHVANRPRTGGTGGGARRGASAITGSRAFCWLVRAGFIARGLTYGLIGALALAMALGAGTAGNTPNQQGALSLIARAPLGQVALLVIAAGLLAYALWKFAQGFLGYGPEGGGGAGLTDRVGNMFGGVVYVVFFLVAVRILTGSSGGSSGAPKQAAAGILGWPGGQFLVGIAGLVMIGVSLYQVVDALRGGFADETKTEQMNAHERRLYMRLGRVGLTARGAVFALVGYFLIRTALTFKANSGVGVNGALAKLQHQPFGPWLLGLVAAGLLIFAVHSFFEARYRRL